MPKQTLNIAMIGTGSIAKAHSNAFRQVTHFFNVPYDLTLKVICGRNQTKLESAAAQWEWQEIATDWQVVVSRPDIDVVDIAVPNALHAPIAIAAAQAGKIVFWQKPRSWRRRCAKFPPWSGSTIAAFRPWSSPSA